MQTPPDTWNSLSTWTTAGGLAFVEVFIHDALVKATLVVYIRYSPLEPASLPLPIIPYIEFRTRGVVLVANYWHLDWTGRRSYFGMDCDTQHI